MSKAAFTQARFREINTATSPEDEAHGLSREAEAIKLLSAEVMEAYGLCRPAQTDQHVTKTS
jgi:hypothetical protein